MYIFTVPQAQDENNRPVKGVFTWTALSRKHKLTVLRELPPMMDTILPENDAVQIGRLWKVNICIDYKHMDLNDYIDNNRTLMNCMVWLAPTFHQLMTSTVE